jgi:hypothetical protein
LVTRKYEESIRQLTGGTKNRVTSPADWPVEGFLVHIAGDTGSDFRVVEVWEPEEALHWSQVSPCVSLFPCSQ